MKRESLSPFSTFFRNTRLRDSLFIAWDPHSSLDVFLLLDAKTKIPTTNTRLILSRRKHGKGFILDNETRTWKTSWGCFMNIVHRQALIDWFETELKNKSASEREKYLIQEFGEKRGRLFESKIQRDIIGKIDSLYRINSVKEMLPLIVSEGYYAVEGLNKEGVFLNRDLDNFEKTIIDTLFSGNLPQLVSPFSADDKQIVNRYSEKGVISLEHLNKKLEKTINEFPYCYFFNYPWVSPIRVTKETGFNLNFSLSHSQPATVIYISLKLSETFNSLYEAATRINF